MLSTSRFSRIMHRNSEAGVEDVQLMCHSFLMGFSTGTATALPGLPVKLPGGNTVAYSRARL
jgi:hypothetical protein